MRDSKPEDVVAHGIAILEAVGMPAEDARLVSESPVTSDMWGHPSHGMHTGIRALVVATRESIGNKL